MRLESLTVRGVLAITGTTTIDFSTLPPGLIAFVGRNGNGKTTLLDAAPASIHRKMPSRIEKKLTDYANERDSFIETVWAFDGRGVVKLRVSLDGAKGDSKAVIALVNADGSEAVLNDGKLTTYDETIAQWFPPQDVLLASAVAAQNKEGSFSRIAKPERQALFAKLLGLERYKAMAELARQCAGLADVTRAKLAGRVETLARDADPALLDAIVADHKTLDAARVDVEAQRADLTMRKALLEAERDGYQEQAATYGRVKDHLKTLADLSAELLILTGTLGTKKHKVEEAAVRELRDATDAHKRTLLDFDQRIQNNRSVLERADVIRKAAEDRATLAAEIAAFDRTIAICNEDLDAITQKHVDLGKQINSVRGAGADLGAAIADAGTLKGVPCEGAGPYAGCSFLTRAQRAMVRIPDLEQAMATFDTLDAAMSACEAERLDVLAKRTEAFREKQRRHEALDALEPSAKLLPTIETAEARIADLTTERARTVALHDAAGTAIQTRRDAALTALSAEIKAALDKMDAYGAEVAQLNIVEDETKAASDNLARCHADLTALAREWDAITARAATIAADAVALDRRRQWFHTADLDLALSRGQLRKVEDHLLGYQLLTKALGKDGLPTLEIDAAGPTVSSFCNDLLATCFGPRFSVEIVTQEATQKGGMKDAFNLKVYDNERGGKPRDLEDLSGGEQIIVDEALKNAIAAFVNSRNVAPVQTMWRDETTGPLDGPNAEMYLDMLRKVREIAGVVHLLFVTHNRDAAMQADAQIVVENGEARVVLPPYSEVA